MKAVWHYFDGQRAVVLAPWGKDVPSARGQATFHPASLADPRSVSERLESAARSLERGESDALPVIFQHTERRFPMLYALMPVSRDEQEHRGYGALRELVGNSGGEVFPWSPGKRMEPLVDCLLTAVGDLAHGYLVTVEIPNDSQEPAWKRVTARSSRPKVRLRAPSFYRASGELCHYVPSYLVAPDPVQRLVAAQQASACWRSSDVEEMMEARLAGPPEDREPEPLVRAELLRSYVAMRFRQLQEARSSRQRRKASQAIAALESLWEGMDPALLQSYREISMHLEER